jgi:REP element-mobilizing transposase RayT
MARAKRHYIPGHIWHLTHRCHKREFLLKFAKDRRRWLHWLLEAKRRYGLVILNYMVTSNHIHLLVVDDGDRDVIPRSIQLVAGRKAWEYNQRKKRKGACVFQSKSATHSIASRPLIPLQASHPFQSNPAGDSAARGARSGQDK